MKTKTSKMKRFILRGKTNDGNLVKQYCFVTENKALNYEKSLIIHRLILTDNFEDYCKTSHTLVKTYKGKGLFMKSFSIKLSTLKQMIKIAESI